MPVNTTHTSEPGAFINLLGQIAYDLHLVKPMIPTYIHMVLSALFPIYIASHASLSRPQSAAGRKQTKKILGDEDTQEEEVSPRMVEIMSASDAIILPLFAGIVLTALYFALHYIKDGLNWALNVWFGLFGVVTIYAFLSDTFATVINFIFPSSYSVGKNLVKVDANSHCYRCVTGPASFKSPFPGIFRYLPFPSAIFSVLWRIRDAVTAKATLTLHVRSFVTVRLQATLADVVAVLLSIALSYVHTFVAKPWILGNLFGTSFCYFSLQTTSPSSAWIGTLVLSAFFLYDIWAVFFTPMMIHVAQNVTAPLMMKFPRSSGGVAGLGLGDIVVPGMVMAFALQLDLHRHYLKMQKNKDGDENEIIKQEYRPVTGGWGERFWTTESARPEHLRAKTFHKTYFRATMIGYVLGLVASAVAVNIFDHGQPALLYLVPGVLGALWSTALINGELNLLWSYSESAEEEQKEETKSHTSTGDKDIPEHDSDGNKKAVVKSNPPKNDLDKTDSELTPELREITDQHIFYLAVKLPLTADATKKNDDDAPAHDDARSAGNSEATSSSDSEAQSHHRPYTHATKTTASSAPQGSARLRRSNRASGAAALGRVGAASGHGAGGEDGDEEKARMTKRRRQV